MNDPLRKIAFKKANSKLILNKNLKKTKKSKKTVKSKKKTRNKNLIKTKLFLWSVNAIDNRLWHFVDTFKYERVSWASFSTDCFEILHQHTLTYLFFIKHCQKSYDIARYVSKKWSFCPGTFLFRKNSSQGKFKVKIEKSLKKTPSF